MSVTVNYQKFTEKFQSLLKNLMETHKYATFDFDEKSMMCTISWPYAEIQNTAQEFLSKLGMIYTIQKLISADSQSQSKTELHKIYPEPLGIAQAWDYPYVPRSQTAVKQNYSETTEILEHFQEPLLWETDIFKYMQKFHLTEYQDIQKQYHILAVDENYDDLTEIYLETESGYKTHLEDLKCARSKLLVLYRSLELLHKQFRASNMSAGLPHSLSSTKKHECGVGSRIATSFNAPTTQSLNSAKSNVDEEHLVLPTSPGRLPLDCENYLSDVTSMKSNVTEDLQKKEAVSQPEENSENMAMQSVKRQDVLPASNIVRGDLGNSGATPKPTGILKPVQSTKKESKLPYSSLVDNNPPCADFKVPEVKPRRSNSLARVYSKGRTSTEPHSDTLVFKDEVNVADWQWHYMTQMYKSDILQMCSEVELTNEKKYGKVALKMKSFNKERLAAMKEKIQLLAWKIHLGVTYTYFDYALLGVQGPNDKSLRKWCDLFHRCSRRVSVKLEKDKLVLIYPKQIQECVLEAYRQHTNRTMPDIGQVSSQNRFKSNATDGAEGYITEHNQSLSDKQHATTKYKALPFLLSEDMDEEKIYLASKHLADERYAQLNATEPFQRIAGEYETFITPVPGSLDENRSTLQKTDYYTLTETFTQSPYTSEILMQGINVPSPNVPVGWEKHYSEQYSSTEDHVVQYEGSPPQQRIPAVGQESDMTNSVCSKCNNISKTVQTSSGQMQCVTCFAISVITALKEATKAPLRVFMNHTTMSLRLPGYEQDTSLKIIYEVADGVQGAGDPQPGCQYKGGKFEAYLPDNQEGRILLSLLQRALDQGLIFQIRSCETGEEVTWYKIPHKTSPDGGKAKNGYPDLTYVRNTIALLYQYGIYKGAGDVESAEHVVYRY